MCKRYYVALLTLVCSFSVLAAYNVRRPSEEIKPRWTGARAGEWSMDYEAVRAKARATGKCYIFFITGSWWCPHCEAFEEKVLLSDTWRSLIAEKGFYLGMLDFPYRGTVKEEELFKSKHPELGSGWGFQCWLYDDDYLSENGLSEQDGLREIMKRYELQKSLAPDSATQVTIKTWDGSSDFSYGKVGYPSLIVYLPDGTEAGRFTPFVTYMDPQEARAYVAEQINTIVSTALDAQCGLCSDPNSGGLRGSAAQQYEGWLSSVDHMVAGSVSVKVGKKNTKGVMKLRATFSVQGKKTVLSASVTNGYKNISFFKKLGQDIPVAVMRFGDEGLTGSYYDGTDTYVVTGSRNAFLTKDLASKVRTIAYRPGTWGLGMNPMTDSYQMARGYGSLSVTLGSKGKAMIKGKLGDGKNVNLSGQVIPGEDGVFCLPIVASLYNGKKGGFGCCLWFKNGWFFNVTETANWKNGSTNPTLAFDVPWTPIYTALPDTFGVADELELMFRDTPTEIDGLPLIADPDLDPVTSYGKTLRGTEASKFFVRLNTTTGLLSGSMYFFSLRGPERTKKVKADVSGVVIGDAGYCSVVVKGKYSWAVKISPCSACED